MSRSPYKALGTFPTPHGVVICRKVMSAKQGSFILVLESRSHAALRLLLPEWRPRAPSTRTQLTPPEPTKKVSDIMAFYQQQVPLWYERLSGKSVPTATSTTPSPSYATLGELMRVVEHEAASSVRSLSIETYRHQWHAVLHALDPGMPVSALTRERLQEVMASLGKSYASTTLKNLRTALNKLLVRAVEDGVLVRNPLAKVKIPRAIAQPKQMITRQQRDAVLAEAERRGRDVHLLFALMLLAGLRRREVLAVSWQANCDLEHRTLSVTNTEDFISKSGDACRHIPIGNELFVILARYHRSAGLILAENRPFSGSRWRWTFTKVFASVTRAAGVPWLHPHLCRHVYSSFFIEGGGSIFRLARALGHSTATVTERYLHLVPGFVPDDGATVSIGPAQSISA